MWSGTSQTRGVAHVKQNLQLFHSKNKETKKTERLLWFCDWRSTQLYLETIRHDSEVGWMIRHSSLPQRVETQCCSVDLLQATPHVQNGKWDKITTLRLAFVINVMGWTTSFTEMINVPLKCTMKQTAVAYFKIHNGNSKRCSKVWQKKIKIPQLSLYPPFKIFYCHLSELNCYCSLTCA